MTDHSKDPLGDPFDLLRAHVRAVALLEQPAVDADELVADITGRVDRADRSRGAQVLPIHGFAGARSPRRRRWFVAAAAGAIVAVGGAGVAAYVALRPTDPRVGIVCRESDDFGSSSLQLPFDVDPIAACANLWKTGDLSLHNAEDDSGAIPDLIACTGGIGVVDVLPVAGGETCESFGLTPLTRPPEADPVTALVVAVSESNQIECVGRDDLVASASSMLERFGLTDWRIEVEPGTERCAVLGVDIDASTLIVRRDPIRSSSSQEIP